MPRPPRPRRSPSSRFWNLVKPVTNIEDCWPWLGATAEGTGYGLFNNGEKTVLAHVYSFELTRTGIDRKGLVVRHTCDNPVCVNPHHLQLGTHADNSRDMDERGRRVNNPAKGEGHYRSKLTEQQVLEIRRLGAPRSAAIGPAMSTKGLAKMYNVSESAIIAVIKRRTWGHL